MAAIVPSEELSEEQTDLIPRLPLSKVASDEASTGNQVAIASQGEEESEAAKVGDDGSCEARLRPWIARRFVSLEKRLVQTSEQCVEASDGVLREEDTDGLNESHEYKPPAAEKCFDVFCEAFTCSDLTGLGRPGNKIPTLKRLEKFASDQLRKARAHGLETIAGIMRNPYTATCLGAFFRDLSIYSFVLLSVILWINVIIGVIYDQVTEDDKEDDVYRLTKLGVSTIVMLLSIADLVHHTCAHEYLTCKECTRCESNSDASYESCQCPRWCPVVFDCARLTLIELFNYANLLLSIFQLIIQTVVKDGKVDAITCISVILTSLIAFSHVYIPRWFVLVGSIFSIQKIRTGDEKITWRSLLMTSSARFHIAFVLNAIGHTIIQMTMIAAIGTRFNHEYQNFNSSSVYIPSFQLGYMMVFAYLGPIFGAILFLVTCHFWSQQFPVELVLDMIAVLQRPGFNDALKSQNGMDELASMLQNQDSPYLNDKELSNDFNTVKGEGLFHKLAYPFKSPLHILVCFVYCFLVISFWVCAMLGGSSETKELVVYTLASLYAVFVNGYAFAIVLVWMTILVIAILAIVPIIIAFIIICVCSRLDSSNSPRNEY